MKATGQEHLSYIKSVFELLPPAVVVLQHGPAPTFAQPMCYMYSSATFAIFTNEEDQLFRLGSLAGGTKSRLTRLQAPRTAALLSPGMVLIVVAQSVAAACTAQASRWSAWPAAAPGSISAVRPQNAPLHTGEYMCVSNDGFFLPHVIPGGWVEWGIRNDHQKLWPCSGSQYATFSCKP